METHRGGLCTKSVHRHDSDDAPEQRSRLRQLQGRTDAVESGRGARGSHLGRGLQQPHSGRLRSQHHRGQTFWTGKRESGRGLGTGTQCALRQLQLFRIQQPTRRQDLLAHGNGHAGRRRMHRATSDANLFFAIQEVDVRSSQPIVRGGGQHRIVSVGPGVLRSGAIDPGGKSETSSPPRNHHSRFGGRATIGGTLALPVAPLAKQRGRNRARASVRSRRQSVETTQRQDHGDGGPESRIKRRDDACEPSHRPEHQA